MMNRITRRIVVAGLVSAGLTFLAARGWALGFRNPDQDARATGQGEAFVAQADDASAIWYNPAGLIQLQGTEFKSGAYILFPESHFRNGPDRVEMNSPAMLPHMYAASSFGQAAWRFGLGVNAPFGNMVDYGDGGRFKYTATRTSMTVVNIQPTVAFKVSDRFSLGAALNVYHGETELNRITPIGVLLGNPALGERLFEFHGDGLAAGATVGGLYRINDHHSIGAVYRSPFTIDFHGAAVINKDPTPSHMFGHSDASAAINFPQSVAVGYAFRPTPALKLEVDVEWTNWETLNTLKMHSANPSFNSASNPTSAISFRWKDSFFYEAGIEYQIAPRWTVRGGYIWSDNSVPDRTFSASVPDSNRQIFSGGLGYTAPRWDISLAYQFTWFMDRTVRNSPDLNFDGVGDADGRWSGYSHALMFTTGLKF
jgi:long-chain fatty acid transport protein